MCPGRAQLLVDEGLDLLLQSRVQGCHDSRAVARSLIATRKWRSPRIRLEQDLACFALEVAILEQLQPLDAFVVDVDRPENVRGQGAVRIFTPRLGDQSDAFNFRALELPAQRLSLLETDFALEPDKAAGLGR